MFIDSQTWDTIDQGGRKINPDLLTQAAAVAEKHDIIADA